MKLCRIAAIRCSKLVKYMKITHPKMQFLFLDLYAHHNSDITFSGLQLKYIKVEYIDRTLLLLSQHSPVDIRI